MPRRRAHRRLAALLPGLALAAAAQAQSPPLPPLPPLPPQAPMEALQQLAQAEIERQVFIGDGAGFPGWAAPGAERVVKGAPYCADAEHETVQWLADGAGGAPNRITRRQTTRLCRDGEGRTRQEVERDGRRWVYLRDPMAREAWLLDPERRSARPLGGGLNASVDAAVWRDFAERTRDWARGQADRARAGGERAPGALQPAPPTPPLPPSMPPMPAPVVIEQSEGPGGRQTEVRVVRLGGEGAPPAAFATPPPAVAWRAQVLAPRGPGSVSPLPARDIDGVRANGERTTWVIEAGKVGNEKPIQMTREVWSSPDLMVTLQSRDFDPRSGEVNYRLKNVRRGEPDAALMRVPADFQRAPVPARTAPRASGATG